MYITNDFTGVDAEFDTLDYHSASLQGSNYSVISRGEKRLWCAVIHQAFIDMLPLIIPPRGSTGSPRSVKHRLSGCDTDSSKAAMKWLLTGTRDFNYVCLQAGFSPETVRRAAMMLAKHYALIQ